eukprot:Lankesteria_metandrocarpae@DN2232_c0_g1_i1.p1
MTVVETTKQEDPQPTDRSSFRETLSALSDAIDLLFGNKPENVLKVVNCCVGGLIVVTLFLCYSEVKALQQGTQHTSVLLWMHCGFLLLTGVFSALVNFFLTPLLRDLPPKKNMFLSEDSSEAKTKTDGDDETTVSSESKKDT